MRALLLVLLAVGVVACGDGPAEKGTATVQVRGVYLGPRFDGQAALIDHEAVSGRMPAMAMALRVSAPALLDSLRPGDKVRLTLDSLSLSTILDVQRISPETTLDLHDGEDGRGGARLPDVDEP